MSFIKWNEINFFCINFKCCHLWILLQIYVTSFQTRYRIEGKIFKVVHTEFKNSQSNLLHRYDYEYPNCAFKQILWL